MVLNAVQQTGDAVVGVCFYLIQNWLIDIVEVQVGHFIGEMVVQEGDNEGNAEIVDSLDVATGRVTIGPDVEQTL